MSTEIEVRFLEVDKERLVTTLQEMGATDQGEALLREVILYDKDLKWQDQSKRVRVRQRGDVVEMTYKEGNGVGMHTVEYEVTTSDFAKTVQFLEATGLCVSRTQEKCRHTFVIDDVIIDIDTWPNIPTYVELEGCCVKDLQKMAHKIGFVWQDRFEKDAYWIIKDVYGIDLYEVKDFTFGKSEVVE